MMDIRETHTQARIDSLMGEKHLHINIDLTLPDRFPEIDEKLLIADLRTDIEDLLKDSGFELDAIHGGITSWAYGGRGSIPMQVPSGIAS